MAKKQAVNKMQAVLDYLKAHPAAMCKEIAEALEKQGIKITLGHVATIKMKIEATKTAAVEAAAPRGKPTEPLTLDQLKKVAQAITRIRLHRVEPMALAGGLFRRFWG